MSRLTERKSKLVVETANAVFASRRHREIVVEMKPDWMELRLKGTRQKWPLSYTSALNLAIRNEKLRKQLEKAKTSRTKSC